MSSCSNRVERDSGRKGVGKDAVVLGTDGLVGLSLRAGSMDVSECVSGALFGLRV